MEKKYIGQNWYLGETLHSGIGQGYFQSTPIQLCLMTAQIANGGFEIKPRIIFDKSKNSLKEYLKFKNDNPGQPLPTDLLVSNFELKPLFKNQENIKIVKDAMYSSSNEPGGTSYGSRLEDRQFTFAGKTGSSQVKRFTEEQREAEVKQEQLKYENRDHALFIAFAPVSDPKYAISVVVEHGGSGSKSAAPIAKRVIKKVLERHSLRQSMINSTGEPVLMFQPRSIQSSLSFRDKLLSIDYVLVITILILGIVSMFAMYSTDGGQFKYHTESHIIRFLIFFIMFIVLSFIQIRFWHNTSYLIYIFFLFLLFVC